MTFISPTPTVLVMLALAACTAREAPHPTAVREAALRTVVIPIEGMSCSACVARVRKTLASVGGVSEVHVNLVDRNASVRFDPSMVSADRLVGALNGLGYHAGAPQDSP